MIPVILSGGAGTRLWPLSRKMYPKQFIDLVSEHTLFQETLIRLKNLSIDAPIIVCNEEHRFTAAENLQQIGIGDAKIVLEPAGRNTAPAIAAAAHVAILSDKDAILLVLPADHTITNVEAFQKAVLQAHELAQNDKLVTFGIKPAYAHTGYGYIEKGRALQNDAYAIKDFKEKPESKTAEEFFNSNDYLWNSGMFCFKASVILDELKKHSPEIVKHTKESVKKAVTDLDFLRLDKDYFEQCENISIDYAVMEKTSLGAIISLDVGWNDIGSWDALWDSLDKDSDGNSLQGDVIAKDSRNNLVIGNDRLVSILGAENLIIVDTQDALLVADKSRSQNIKSIVETLSSAERSEVKHHRTVYRPWGHYDSICKGERDQVKRITVKPGAKLSIQKHFHRSEHWVVVKGTAHVTKGDELITLTENESVYLPLGVVHALENPGKIPLEIIEIQTGSYLGEDDIVRLKDNYGRV